MAVHSLPTHCSDGRPVNLPLAVVVERTLLVQGKPCRQWLVQWIDLPPEDSTWESEDSIDRSILTSHPPSLPTALTSPVSHTTDTIHLKDNRILHPPESVAANTTTTFTPRHTHADHTAPASLTHAISHSCPPPPALTHVYHPQTTACISSRIPPLCTPTPPTATVTIVAPNLPNLPHLTSSVAPMHSSIPIISGASHTHFQDSSSGKRNLPVLPPHRSPSACRGLRRLLIAGTPRFHCFLHSSHFRRPVCVLLA